MATTSGRAERRLIVNADDLGIGERVTDAILDSHRDGIVTSTTLMANMPAFEYACERSKNFPELGIGLHVNLSEGRPVSAPDNIPALVDASGLFHDPVTQSRQLWWGSRVARQVETEIDAQACRALDRGIELTHFDSHVGLHKMPIVRNAILRVGHRRGILRVRSQLSYRWPRRGSGPAMRLHAWWANAPRGLVISGHWLNHTRLRLAGFRLPDFKPARHMLVPLGTTDEKERLLDCLANLPVGVNEMVFHPGYGDPTVRVNPHFEGVREIDTALVFDPDVKDAIHRNGIELISFRDL